MVEEEVEVAPDARDDGKYRGDDERGEGEGGKVGPHGGRGTVHDVVETGRLCDFDDPLAHPSTTEQGHNDGGQSRGSVNGLGEEVPDLTPSDQPSEGRDEDELAEVLLVELVKLGRDCTGLGEDLLDRKSVV